MTPEECQAYADNLIAERAAKKRLQFQQWAAGNRDHLKASKKKHYENCGGREDSRARAKQCREENPDKVLFNHREWRYGITRSEYETMFEAQGRCCAICKTDNPGTRAWHLDHNHVTKKIRGILCRKCNIGLGHFRDRTDLLVAGIEYLEKHNELQKREPSRPQLAPDTGPDPGHGPRLQPHAGDAAAACRAEQGPGNPGPEEGRPAGRWPYQVPGHGGQDGEGELGAAEPGVQPRLAGARQAALAPIPVDQQDAEAS